MHAIINTKRLPTAPPHAFTIDPVLCCCVDCNSTHNQPYAAVVLIVSTYVLLHGRNHLPECTPQLAQSMVDLGLLPENFLPAKRQKNSNLPAKKAKRKRQ